MPIEAFRKFRARIESAFKASEKAKLPSSQQGTQDTPKVDLQQSPDSEANQPFQPTPWSHLMTCDQHWDAKTHKWVKAPPIRKVVPVLTHKSIAVYHRRGAGLDRDHIWIELRIESLVDLLRPHFKGYSGFSGAEPGVDARHVYARRTVLAELANKPNDPENAIRQNRIAYAGLRELLDFVDEEFKAVTTQLNTTEEPDPQIEWSSLWALFPKGALVETEDTRSGQDIGLRVGSWAYKTHYGTLYIEITGSYPQWTGRRYVEMSTTHFIIAYEGTQPLSTLKIKPLTEQRRQELADRGKIYIQFAGVHHLEYKSIIIWDGENEQQKGIQKEMADGRLMIDVLSYRRFKPKWDKWDGKDTSEKKGKWLGPINEDHPDLCLLPATLHGWSFAVKKWGEFLVENLSPIPFDPDMLSRLVIPEDDKKLVQSLIEAQAGLRGITLFKDVISGKGAGIVLLLHGNPGTGKTLTAEAISEHLKLPLYSVACCEFGTSLATVETKLKHILDITSIWKAVVLIDEADIFLEARSNDLERNALVGVFLRMLEYHSGIVILTTNRVRNLDQAFQSRINLAIKYKDLTTESRQILWEKFLSRANDTIQADNTPGVPSKFSHDDIVELSKRQTNGRVIKNIVRSSQALALAEGEPLSLKHVSRVWKALDAFEREFQSPPFEQSAAKNIA